MKKIEFARKRAKKDVVWLLIAFAIFTAALGFSLMNLGTSRAVAGNICTSQCKAQFGQCVKSTGDRSTCQQQLSACLDQCPGG